jgi:hypothetical protein
LSSKTGKCPFAIYSAKIITTTNIIVTTTYFIEIFVFLIFTISTENFALHRNPSKLQIYLTVVYKNRHFL